MKPVLTALLFISITFQVKAQDMIRGVLFEKGSSLRVANATITNLKKKVFSQTDGLGAFSINASTGDTLKITKAGFMEQTVVISSFTDLIIHLARPVQLSEVRVTGQSKKQELDEVKRQYRRKGSYYAGKPPLLSYIFTPLTALYELVGKTPGQARRFNRYYSREIQESEIDRRFNPYTVKILTGYEGADLQNFVQTYRPNFEQVITWADYDLVNYIKRSVLTFESAGRPAARALPPLPRAPDLREKIVIKD
ncbi:hypothetical protein GZH53_19270 [Flavihumibacter sp. R14]|nr:hypothetical protein [Flavihumibacter soli]